MMPLLLPLLFSRAAMLPPLAIRRHYELFHMPPHADAMSNDMNIRFHALRAAAMRCRDATNRTDGVATPLPIRGRGISRCFHAASVTLLSALLLPRAARHYASYDA